jgi:hypothetical protein
MEAIVNLKKIELRNAVLDNLSKLINLNPENENLFDIYKELEWVFSEDKVIPVQLVELEEKDNNNLLFIP